MKVVHSGRQDLEILWNIDQLHSRRRCSTRRSRPWSAAMATASPTSSSPTTSPRPRIDKSSRFTDWSKRPLSEAQLVYARSDVTHLRARLSGAGEEAREDRAGRHWLANEMADPDLARDLRGPSRGCLAAPEGPRAQAAGARDPDGARRLARARGAEPRRAAQPRAQGRRDDGHRHRRARARAEALGHLRSIPSGFERSRAGAEIVAAVERGLERDPKSLPALERGHRRPFNQATVDLLKVLLKMVSEQQERRRQDHRHRRRPRGHRRRRRGRCAGAAGLAARAVRRTRPWAEARPARAGRRERQGHRRHALSAQDARVQALTTFRRWRVRRGCSTKFGRAADDPRQLLQAVEQAVAGQRRQIRRQARARAARARSAGHARQHARHGRRDQIGDAHRRAEDAGAVEHAGRTRVRAGAG